jgi:hypothetical protein
MTATDLNSCDPVTLLAWQMLATLLHNAFWRSACTRATE